MPGKVFGKILNDRMRIRSEGKLMEEQVGFRPERGCVRDTSIGREDDRERKETVCSLAGSRESV